MGYHIIKAFCLVAVIFHSDFCIC